MNAKAATCPSQQLLADYGLGKLDNAASDTIHEHLETCAECRTIADRAPGDSFVIRLREANAQPAIADTPGRPAGASPAGKQPASDRPANVPPELANHPDYEFLKELGRGGMGIVYLARNRMMDRLEVLKVVSKSLLERPGALERFQQEIRSAAKLSHPNIVAAYTVLRPGDLLVFAMEYVDGQDLSQVVKQRGALPVTNATFYVQQVALGLQHAHDKGMVHRDIKPNNLMLAVVGKKHVVKILDFGLAKATSEKAADAGLTKSGQMMGTPDYIAPEQSLDAQKADIRADIYSLGCTLYYLLAGHTPFRGNSLYEILQAHHQTEARPLNLERPEVPAELAAIVSKMMAKDPTKRFQTPMEVAKALNPFFKAGAAAAAKLDALLPPDVSIRPQSPAPAAAAAPAEPVAQPVPLIAQPIRLAMAQPVSIAPLPQNSLAGIEATSSRPRTKARAKRRRIGRPVAIGLLLAGVLGLGAVMFKFRTTDGVVAIEVNEPNPEVFVDGNRAIVTWDAGGMQAEISLPAGSRKIELKKDGFKASGETVELESRGRRVLIARLEPLTNMGHESSTAAAPPPAIAPFDAKQARAHQEAWAKYLGVPFEQANSIGMTLVVIPPGEFLMGSTPEQSALGRKMAEDSKLPPTHGAFVRLKEEGPQHRVAITRPFWLGTTEVTTDQFKKFVEATKYVTQAEQYSSGNSGGTKVDDKITPEQKKLTWRTPGYAVTDDSPVTQVTWNDAVQFCNWLSNQEKLQLCYRKDAGSGWTNLASGTGYRLPTEAEWEYGCRAGTTTQFSFGDDPAQLDIYGWFNKYAGGSAHAVGLKVANAFDLFDMHGNVYEWCQDFYAGDDYSKTSSNDPTGPTSGSVRVGRGGGWVNNNPVYCRSAYRNPSAPVYRDYNYGFRVVRVSVAASGKTTTVPLNADDSRPPHELLHAYRQRIKAAWPEREDRLRIDEQNHLKLDLHDCLEVHDLTPLAGMRLHWLSLINCKEVGDIAPLRGMPLAYLNLTGCRDVTSLESLKGMPLEELYFCNASDLTPLAGAPLRMVFIFESGVTDLRPLVGAPLMYIELRGCTRLADLSPLQRMPLTEMLVCGQGALHDLSPLRGMKLQKLEWSFGAPVSDLTPLTDMPLNSLKFGPWPSRVKDLSPLRGVRLSSCHLGGCVEVKDFTPLAGMPLTELYLPPTARDEDLRQLKNLPLKRLTILDATHLSDLAPTAKMPLEYLNVGRSERVADLAPLAGKELQTLWIFGTAVTDITPLRGMELNEIRLTPGNISKGLEILRAMRSLRTIGIGEKDLTERFTAIEFWKRYDAGEFGKPVTNINDPAFQAWIKTVAAMPAEKQVEAVSKKLMEQNPGFDGKVTGVYGSPAPKIEKGVVTELGFITDNVIDISPVRALLGLKTLVCNGSTGGKGKLSNLSPLAGMSLTHLSCNCAKVSSLSPLQGMPLTTLNCDNALISDLSPLEGMPLTVLSCRYTQVSDLSPLVGLPLTSLACDYTKVSDLRPLQRMKLKALVFSATPVADLSPLTGMTLTALNGAGTQVSDLSPLRGMPLTTLYCDNTKVSDLSPLRGMNLTDVRFTPKNITKGLDVVRQMASLKTIGISNGPKDWSPPAEFWKRYDAGEFGKPITNINDPAFQQWMKTVAALPAEKQIEAVSKKLMELNPGFDGKVTGASFSGNGTPKVENGVVTELGFVTDNVTDLSPVRALLGLKNLTCHGGVVGGAAESVLSDLSPLQGMTLTKLDCARTQVSDLSRLKGMKLTYLEFSMTQVSDLSHLEGMPLTEVHCYATKVFDLTPLRRMKLTYLQCGGTQVSDLSPLQGMPMTMLICSGTQVSDLSPLRGMKLTGIDCRYTQVSDLSPLKGMKLTQLHFPYSRVADLSPLQGMPLADLSFQHSPVSDLSPLKGMPLKVLNCESTRVSDLTPLRGMPLTFLLCFGTKISDLTPLQDCQNLTDVRLTPKKIGQGMDAIRSMKSLKIIGIGPNNEKFPAAEFWKKYDAGEFGKSITDINHQLTAGSIWKGSRTYQKGDYAVSTVDYEVHVRERNGAKFIGHKFDNGPNRNRCELEGEVHGTGVTWRERSPGHLMTVEGTFVGGGTGIHLTFKALNGTRISSEGDGKLTIAWLTDVRALPAEKQVEAVSKKLMELNPGFDGKVIPKIVGGVVTEFRFVTDNVIDISPVRALAGLRLLSCDGSIDGKGRLSDLSPLEGMRLAELSCRYTQVEDLSPLKDTPLTDLNLYGCAQVQDLAPLRGMKLNHLLLGCRQVRDLTPLKGMPLTILNIWNSGTVQDLTPLEGMPLTDLGFIGGCEVRDLTPLKGMPLTLLSIGGRELRDLTPLRGLKLARLRLYNSQQLRDLTPLQGMPITWLDLSVNCEQVQDLTPLQAMTLDEFFFIPQNITKGIEAIRRMKSLKTIGISPGKKDQLPPAEFWKRYDAGEFGKPVPARPITNINDPAFQAWMKTVAAMPAEKQVDAVSKKLMVLNPGFDGKLMGWFGQGTPKVEKGVVTELGFLTDEVADLSPVRALAGLRRLFIRPASGNGRLADLTALDEMKLTSLDLGGCGQVQDLSPLKDMPLASLGLLSCKQVSDLTPLEGVPLTNLDLAYCDQVQDLAPLRGMKLNSLGLNRVQVRELTALQGMPLTSLGLWGCGEIRDLSPLRGMKLTSLQIGSCRQVRDLMPLKGMPLASLNCERTQVSDLSPLDGMSLTYVNFTPKNITKGLDIIRQMKSLKTIGIDDGKPLPAAEFWKKYDAGEFASKDPTATAASVNAARPAGGGPGALKKPVAPLPPTKISTTPPAVTEEQLRQRIETAWPGLGKRLKKDAAGNYTLFLRDCPQVTDLTPLKGMPLTTLNITWNGQLWDLTPLHGLKLKSLWIGHCGQIRDLRPLQGMELDFLDLDQCNQLDLTHLNGMKIKLLSLWNRGSNERLRALQYVKLNGLIISASAMDDLTALKGMALHELIMDNCDRVSTLWPLIGMPLNKLNIKGCDRLVDVTALKDLPLKQIMCDFKPERDAMILRAVKTLETINGEPVAQFWQKFNLPAVTPPPAAAGGASLRPSPIGDRLANAKTTHQDKLKKLKDGLLKNLDKKEAVARATGDKAALERIQQERTNLTTSGAIPKLVPLGDYIRQVRAASVQLESA